MRNSERIVIYTALMVLGALNIIFLTGGGSSRAWAQDAGAAGTETMAGEKLGPAESVTLVDPENKNQSLELRNRKQHLTWGDDAYHEARSIAFLHVGKPLYGLMSSDAYSQPIEQVRSELSAEAKQRDSDLRALYEQIQSLDPKDPATADKQNDFLKQRDEFQKWLQESQQRIAKMEADALMKAYDEIVAAVDVVAERKHIDLVLRFLPSELDEGTEVNNADEAQSVIRGRTAVKYPEDLDITNLVMEELSLDVE